MTTEGFFERRLSEVVDRLTQSGYTDSFRGEADGVRALKANLLHQPEELVVEAIERFEGVTDPGEEAIVLAIRCRTHGCRGTYITPYGKNMSTTDARFISRIPDARRRGA
jgi:hypothetical protein